jgi:diguanylate cyclase (GGDEF)-like protein
VLWHKFIIKRINRFLLLVALSIAISILFGIFDYLIFYKAGNRNIQFFLIIIIHLSIFISLAFLLDKLFKELLSIKELKNFKAFTDSLFRVSSEIEIYEVLNNFIGFIPFVEHSAIFYRSEGSVDDIAWQKIAPYAKTLCNIPSEGCPLTTQLCEEGTRNLGNSRKCSYQLPEYRKGSYICLKVVGSGHTQSILQVYSSRENFFDEQTKLKINSYIELAKPVIKSKRTLHALTKKASTDRLTKLYNRHFLDTYLENQIEAASFSNQQLSIIYIDIDHYKLINDTYGHAIGDHVLVIFSELVLKCIRKSDLVARYGGDEFIAVLPATNTETTYTIAERIRQTLEETNIPSIDGITVPPISCSLGISTFPELCDSMDNLLKSSDMALYKAKQSGRNCTKIYNAELLPNL